MSNRSLNFLSLKPLHAKLRNFWDLAQHNIPESPGIYFLLAKTGIRFQYPKGRSPIFYIGQTSNLRRRLRTHLKWSRQARQKNTRVLPLYWPMYEYGAVFGGRYKTILAKSCESARKLEREALVRFAQIYRCWPIANGAGTWDSLSSMTRKKRKK